MDAMQQYRLSERLKEAASTFSEHGLRTTADEVAVAILADPPFQPKDFKGGERVRIYSEELGHFYGNIAQPSQVANRFQYVQIDGTRFPRWVRNNYIYGENYDGEYAIERVGPLS
jgi:hypothetical protein